MKINCFTIIRINCKRLIYKRCNHCLYCSKNTERNSSFCSSCCELLDLCKDIELDTSSHKLVLNL